MKKSRKPTEKQVAAAKAMAAGMNQAQAALVAGFKNRSVLRSQGVKDLVQKIADDRSTLAAQKRYGLHGALELYKAIADSAMSEDADRIRAQARIDKLMGLEAPEKQGTGDRDGIIEAIAVIQALGLAGSNLAKLADAEVVEQGEVDDE